MILYLTLVYYFLDLDGNILQKSLHSIVMEDKVRKSIATMAEEVMSGLFVVNVSGALLQAIFTWLVLDLMGVKCVFLYALSAAFFKIVPLASTWLVGLIASVQLFLQQWRRITNQDDSASTDLTGSITNATLCLILYSYVDARLSAEVLERQLNLVDPMVLYMSAFLGLYAFGLAGILYGPLLVSMGTIYYHATYKWQS